MYTQILGSGIYGSFLYNFQKLGRKTQYCLSKKLIKLLCYIHTIIYYADIKNK